MGILDKLRPQSKSTHPDPNIRIEAIHELDPADIESLNAFAKDDTDARVRRVAVARIGDAGGARRHRPQRIGRQRARSRARPAGRAGVEARCRGGDDRGGRAGVARPRARARDGGEGARVPTRCAAPRLPRVRDEKSLGSIARHAAEAGARLVALERLTDAAEIEGVALRGEHADAAVAAIDRLSNPSNETLTAIAEKARTKAGAEEGAHAAEGERAGGGARRERSRVQGSRSAEGARPGRADDRRCRRSSDFAQLREAYAAGARGVGRAARRRRHPVEHRSRFRERLERGARAAGRRRSGARRRRTPAPRARAGTGRSRRRVRARRRARPATTSPTASRRRAPRGKACRRCPRRGPRSSIAGSAKRAAPPKSDSSAGSSRSNRRSGCRRSCPRSRRSPRTRRTTTFAASGTRCASSGRRSRATSRSTPSCAPATTRPRRSSKRRSRRIATRKGQQQVENLHRLQALVQKFETRATAESLTLKQTDQLMKDVKLAVGTMGPLPAKQDREDLMVRLQAVRTSLTPRIQELREAEEWKRWANVQVQEELCAKMEALVAARRDRSGKGVERNAHAAGAVEAGRRRAALAGRDAVDALQDRAGAGLRQVQGLLRAAGRPSASRT